MSFCAAHRRLAPWTANATSSSEARMILFIGSSSRQNLFDGQALFHQRGEIAGAQRDHFVVEVVVGIVQETAVRAAALAQEYIRPRPLDRHVREILASHHRRMGGD